MSEHDLTSEKVDLQHKYDEEAESFDNQDWMRQGGDIRVPEGESAHYFVGRKVRMALDMQPPQRDWKAHEIGCSFGQMTALLAQEFEDLTASDLSPSSVELARKRFEHYGVDNVRFIVADVEDMSDIPDGAYDIIYSFSTIRFSRRPDVAMKEIHRTLKPGGYAVIDFPNRRSPWHLLLKPLLGIRKHMHDHLYTKDEAVRLVRDAGFIVEGVEEFLFTSRRLPRYLLPAFRMFDRLLEPTFLRRFAGIIMIAARRP